MNKKIVFNNIDFSDSELESFRFFNDNDLMIVVKLWSNNLLNLLFKDVIQFSYKLSFQIGNLNELIDENDFLKEALSRNYERVPINHPYKLFQLEDINDFPFIQVVAESVTVIKE